MQDIFQVTAVHLTPTEARISIESRIAAGVRVQTTAPNSSLIVRPEVASAVNAVSADTANLKVVLDKYNTIKAAFEKAGTALGAAILTWDGSYDILLAVGQKNCANADDAASLALPVLYRAKNALAMPLSIDLRYDAAADMLRVHVHRAPGNKMVSVQWTTDPSNPASWTEFDACGARHNIKHPPPGTYHVRAASRTAKGKSDYTTPVSVIVA